MKFGPFSFDFGTKSYDDLAQMIRREKGSSVERLKGSPQVQLREYRSWVFSCVSLISERCSTVEFGFYNKNTGDELFSNNKGYRTFTKPFFKPNPIMSFKFIKSFCMIQWDLCGMACIYKARNQLGQVWELWPLNMNDFAGIEVRGDFNNPEIIYTFNFENKTLQFRESELIVLKYPNPISLYEPMSPIQAQAYAIDIDTYVEVYERDFFKNSARIDMALVTDTELDQERADEIKNRWVSKYSGKYHDVAVLSSGLKPVPLKFTNKDFEFLNLANWSYDKILSTYKVPKSKLGGGAANRASSVMDDISFNRECIQPRLSVMDEEFSRGILSSFDERIVFSHYNPIPRDRDMEVKEARVYLSGLPSMTINEYRKETKIGGPVVGGDRILIPKGWIPLDKLDEILENEENDSSDSGSQPSQTDPARHDNDEPHVNPDGTDDRDNLPTEGRAIDNTTFLNKFFELEDDLRDTWNKYIFDNLKKCDKENLRENMKNFFSFLITNTINIIYQGHEVEPIVFDEKLWVSSISEKTAKEYFDTFFKFQKEEIKDWDSFVSEQFDTNPRLVKLTNSLIRATVNYAKWLYMKENNIEFYWKVNGNECLHKARLKNSDHGFEVGGHRLDFPNQILNFACDCTIKPKEQENGV